MKNNKGFSAVILLIILGLAVGAITYVAVKKPLMFGFVDKKLDSIVTPKPPIGNLTPTRDLRGIWKSSLVGKGVQVYGKFTTGPGITTVYEDGDMELIIDSVENNIASGKVRYTNLCAWGQTVAPKPLGTISVPKQCTEDSGYRPIAIRVSGSALDFGTVVTDGATFTMQGSYTTDIMTGSATVTIPAYGVLKGEFHLMRQK
ncbi:MAG: hypothetical protein PHG83_02935 [Patescibacteria group bacterium]|nr:hypothetical protein [Patescibacteria group bacterium]